MRKLFTFLMTMVIAMVANAATITPSMGIGEEAKSIADLEGKTFAIVNKADGKALYGSNNQNLAYDVYASAFVSTNSGYQWKLVSLETEEDASVRSYYRLRLVKPNGKEYEIWGSPGYLNSQPTGGNCSFILGLTHEDPETKKNIYQNGADIPNGAVYDIQYEEGKGFSLKNIGTGLYQGANNRPANAEEPIYFSFVQLIDDYRPAVKELLAEGEAMKAYVSDEAAKEAYDAAIDGIDPDAITGNGLTEAQAVDAALNALAKHQNVKGADMTRVIVNPSFETGNTDGWVNNGFGIAPNTAFPLIAGGKYAERWTWAATVEDAKITQEITGLPNGIYEVSAAMRLVAESEGNADKAGLFLLANEERIPVEAAGIIKATIEVTDGVLVIGAEISSAEGNWANIDDFQLKFEGAPTAELLKEVLATKIGVAQTIVDAKAGVGNDLFMIPTEAFNTFEEALNEAKKVYGNPKATSKQISAATDALAAATDTYNNTPANTPDLKKQYALKSKKGGLYMTLAGEGVLIADEPYALMFVKATDDGKYYLTDGTYYVGTMPNSGWDMSSAADNKEALTISCNIVDGVAYYTLGESKGIVGVDYPTNMKCWADKGGNGDNVLWTIEEVSTANMSVKAGKWGTFVAPFDVAIPEGVKAYKVTGVENKQIVKTEVEKTIPANIPVVLLNETDSNIEKTITGAGVPESATVTEGLLTGIYQAGADIPAGSYVLQTQEEKAGQAFYQVEETFKGKGVANRCYLTMPAGSAPLRAIFLDSEEGTTGIEAAEATDAEDGILYNLAGQKVDASYKGIVIKKGKAMLKK